MTQKYAKTTTYHAQNKVRCTYAHNIDTQKLWRKNMGTHTQKICMVRVHIRIHMHIHCIRINMDILYKYAQNH